jgi:predicted CXXCH cytochrome family protein
MILAAAALAGAGPAALADVDGSPHDFRPGGWYSGDETCVICHTPHDANTDIPASPLWNHEVTTATYTPYTSPTMDVPTGQPGGVSKLCLSCHDGSVALDSFGGAAGETYIDAAFFIDIDLSDDHPVGIDWDHQTLVGQPICSNCHVGPTMDYLGPPFFEGNLECPTCHDPHDQGPPEPGLVRRTKAGSALCFWCHAK